MHRLDGAMDWIDDDATDRGRDDERARAHPSTDSRPIDRSIAYIESSSSTVRIVATEDSFVRSRDRSVGRSVDGWNGMDGHHIHPSTHTYRQTIHIYTTIDPSSSITYSARATDRPTRPTTTDATSRARDVTRRRRLPSTLECRRRDAGLERRRRNERTNERTRLSRLGR